jgi:hypothetical protein
MSKYLHGDYEGTRMQRFALRDALNYLKGAGESDQKIANLLAEYIEEGLVANFPKKSSRAISRPTIQRIRRANDNQLDGIRYSTAGALYNFLCCCEELKTDLYNNNTRVHSSHELAPLLEAIQKHVGAIRGPLDNEQVGSLEGVFYLYRKAWTSPNAETYVRCILRFERVGDAMFYTEEQQFHDDIEELPVNETDTGIVLPFGMNVVLLGKGSKKDLLKFFSFHDFTPYPDGHQKVHSMTGNFIAVYSKGPHPGFRAFAKRTDDIHPTTKFYGPNKLEPEIIEKLQD